ncbi:LAFE_0G14180g1_1 [Lachancea fermentati]|uniref:LAFE_0G14180g1_1 n=1 Tax=Lachancea fermentati TaxID=4955 RepID=A0A1G4MIN5_LACFM|nr:LAFE_0G14180g1_1 [Lachancea fermentati]
MADVFQGSDELTYASSVPTDRQTRYTHWKKNTKLLYDYLNTNSTKWPSLTCQFFPDLDKTKDEHRILLSSFTSSQLPEDESVYVARFSSLKHVPWSSLTNFDMEEMEFKMDNSVKLPSKNLQDDLEIKFPAGDCNRARYCPLNPDIVGTASSNGSIYIFDRTKHGSARQKSISGGESPFEIECNLTQAVEDQDNEVVSIAWNWQREGLLAGCYSKGKLGVWDLTKYNSKSPSFSSPVHLMQVDNKGCNDASWMVHHDSLLACCGDDNVLGLLDIRTAKRTVQSQSNHHEKGINACQFNYQQDMLLASADASGKVNLWDIRDFSEPIKTWEHGNSISALQWNPHISTVIGTADQTDGLVKLWDISQPTDEELIFTHGGHMLGVNDISWNLHDPWLICSVSNDNSVQIWKPANTLVAVV